MRGAGRSWRRRLWRSSGKLLLRLPLARGLEELRKPVRELRDRHSVSDAYHRQRRAQSAFYAVPHVEHHDRVEPRVREWLRHVERGGGNAQDVCELCLEVCLEKLAALGRAGGQELVA